jgi:dipeptidyl aminopeptidase/acylaminoacyl peptidase
MLRRLLAVASIALAFGCGDSGSNPFLSGLVSQPPSADAVLFFVSGSWDSTPGKPRELLALNADGSRAEQLTTCAQAEKPCDFLQVAPSPERNRVVAIRTTPGAEAGASTLYFMDLSRSVETVLFANRRVESVDYSPDGSFILYSAVATQTTQEDLFYSLPNGQQEQNLTQTTTFRERSPRIDPYARTAVYEGIDESGVSRIYLFSQSPLTSGPATGPALPGTPYVVGADADPVIGPDGITIAFRRLTGVGYGGLGSWDLLTLKADGVSTPQVLATGPLFRGAPDWGSRGIVFVETDAATSRSQLVRIQPDGTGRTVLRTEDAAFQMGSPRWILGS